MFRLKSLFPGSTPYVARSVHVLKSKISIGNFVEEIRNESDPEPA